MTTEPASAQPEARRKPVRIDYLICGAGLALGIVATYVFLIISPKLLAHHSLFLETFANTNASIITGGALARVGHQSLVLVILAPLAGVLLYDVFYWWAGVLWGNSILSFYTKNSARAARWVGRTERLVHRRGIWVLVFCRYLPVPNVLVFILGGMSGLPLWAFLIGDVIGTLLWEALLVSLGWAIGHRAVHIVNTINHYGYWVIGGILVLIVVSSIARTRRQLREQAAAAADQDDDIHSAGGSRTRQLG